jgi:transposase
MKKFLFIGIDFSKSKFDVSMTEDIDTKEHKQAVFENVEAGYVELLKWLPRQSKIKRESWLFCGEHTGLYSRGLSDFLVKKHLFIWLVNPLQIKSCSGIKRAKTDSIDARCIAQYACRYVDKAKAYKPMIREINDLRLLSSYRSRLVKNRVTPILLLSQLIFSIHLKTIRQMKKGFF